MAVPPEPAVDELPGPDEPEKYTTMCELHVGRYVLAGSQQDGELTHLIAYLADPENPRAALPLIRGRSMEDKFSMLLSVVPPEWTDVKDFVRAMKAQNAWRNRLAHSALQPDVESLLSEGRMAYKFVKERGADTAYSIDLPGLLRRETEQRFLTMMLERVLLHFLSNAHAGQAFSVVELARELRNRPGAFGWPKHASWDRMMVDVLGADPEA